MSRVTPRICSHSHCPELTPCPTERESEMGSCRFKREALGAAHTRQGAERGLSPAGPVPPSPGPAARKPRPAWPWLVTPQVARGPVASVALKLCHMCQHEKRKKPERPCLCIRMCPCQSSEPCPPVPVHPWREIPTPARTAPGAGVAEPPLQGARATGALAVAESCGPAFRATCPM